MSRIFPAQRAIAEGLEDYNGAKEAPFYVRERFDIAIIEGDDRRVVGYGEAVTVNGTIKVDGFISFGEGLFTGLFMATCASRHSPEIAIANRFNSKTHTVVCVDREETVRV